MSSMRWTSVAASDGPCPWECEIVTESDLLRARHLLREHSKELGRVDQTKLITAASELARNILKYTEGRGGHMHVELLQGTERRGVRVTFVDRGPGIADLTLAMKDGYSSGGGLGLGLPGARRLVDEFSIHSTVGRGTTVVVVKWIR